jgi:hypothetical protein
VERSFRLLIAVVFVAWFVCVPSVSAAQAFTPPQGVGSFTLAVQTVDNTGHWLSDGFFLAFGESVTASVLAEVEYGVTDRLAATVGLPYVFAKYTGDMPPPSQLPVDECACWHSAFQDAFFGVRYRLGNGTWAVTPAFRYGRPTHNYAYQGEAVVGRNLQEAQVGVTVGSRLVHFVPKMSVQGAYTYAFVEKALDTVSIDRSNGFFDVGYPLTRSVFLRGSAIWQHTHGGLRAGSLTGDPFPFPGELNTPERFEQRDRLLRAHYWQGAGGVAYSAGGADYFASVTKYLWGRDAHNGYALTFGITWYFDLSK